MLSPSSPRMHMAEQGRTQEGGGGRAAGCSLPNPQNRNLKNSDFIDIMIQTFYVISSSAEISHWNGQITSTLEFWKINV
jgi:hypothetical protein